MDCFKNIWPLSNIKTVNTKLYENIYRSVNIGMANEMKIICNGLNMDICEIIGIKLNPDLVHFIRSWIGRSLYIYISTRIAKKKAQALNLFLSNKINGKCLIIFIKIFYV